MSRLFGKAKKAPPVMDVLAGLNSNMEELNKREEHYEYKIKEQKKIILANGKKNLSVSMRAMKMMKNYQKQITSIHAIMDNLAELKMQIESAEMNQKTMETYQMASNYLKKNQMSVDKVDDTIDDIQEGVATYEEIQNAITSPLGNQFHDEDELVAEMEELLAEAEGEEEFERAGSVAVQPQPELSLPAPGRTPLPSVSASQLPQVPSHSPGAHQTQAERDLAALQAEFMI
eukprot:TRINITY_DN479_c0_g1_i1.p1 TRINITY_DN479_c0_g1~~TRINITY_DN479_c0_g1_i1.p1  ORF type:complete len:263 (+),score=106.49 TRINITY_DN479_c0_g1_i1:97-789(+)